MINVGLAGPNGCEYVVPGVKLVEPRPIFVVHNVLIKVLEKYSEINAYLSSPVTRYRTAEVFMASASVQCILSWMMGLPSRSVV